MCDICIMCFVLSEILSLEPEKITNNHKCSSTFGTILPCTLLLYALYLVQTRNDKYLKGPLSLLQVRSLKKCCFNSDIYYTVEPVFNGIISV